MQYNRYWIGRGHAERGLPLTGAQLSALDAFEEVLAEPGLALRVPLRRGDLLLVDNMAVLHGQDGLHRPAGAGAGAGEGAAWSGCGRTRSPAARAGRREGRRERAHARAAGVRSARDFWLIRALLWLATRAPYVAARGCCFPRAGCVAPRHIPECYRPLMRSAAHTITVGDEYGVRVRPVWWLRSVLYVALGRGRVRAVRPGAPGEGLTPIATRWLVHLRSCSRGVVTAYLLRGSSSSRRPRRAPLPGPGHQAPKELLARSACP
ncbi:TauD/TfdA family dioxygenase [Kitasatospora albolonga]|uniref:TauD/TfdA family dioxygenase n=1 Tax=Kitasatospora albolonga TaxID=68173 RepID=UPI003CD087FA